MRRGPAPRGVCPQDLVLRGGRLWFRGRGFACTVGRGGLRVDKREGDGATPRGTHVLTGLLYRADRMARPTDWARPIGLNDLWSDDPKDPDYNLMVRAPHGFSHETLRRADRLYDLVLLTDYNWPDGIPDRGSAIFLHRWRKPGHPTEGCIALRPEYLRWIASRIGPRTRMIIR